jgi:lysozyme family protein
MTNDQIDSILEGGDFALEVVPDPRARIAIAWTLGHEGRKLNDPVAGPTDYGISLRYLQSLTDADGDGWLDGDLNRDGDVDALDILALDPDRAARIYFEQWWERYDYGLLQLALGKKVFDTAVNTGPGRAHRLLQLAVRGAGGPILKVDGLIGPKTLAAVAVIDAYHLVGCYCSEQAGFYRTLAKLHPGAYAVNLGGWLNRAYDR